MRLFRRSISGNLCGGDDWQDGSGTVLCAEVWEYSGGRQIQADNAFVSNATARQAPLQNVLINLWQRM
jgi:hypothetical protein